MSTYCTVNLTTLKVKLIVSSQALQIECTAAQNLTDRDGLIVYHSASYCMSSARGVFRGGALGHGSPFGSPGLQNCIEK